MTAVMTEVLSIVGANVVLQEGGNFDEETLNGNLDELTKCPDLEKAKRFREKSLIKNVKEDGSIEAYKVCSIAPNILGRYGVGLELYFFLLKYTSCLFLCISLISLWPLIENFNGDGLAEGEAQFFYCFFSIANRGSGLDEVDRIKLALADVTYSLLFLVFIIIYYIQSCKVVKNNYRENITAGDYSLQVKGIPETIKDPQVVAEHFSQYGEVAECCLARKYDDLLDDYIRRASFTYQLGYQRRVNPESKICRKLELKIHKFDDKIGQGSRARLTHDELPTDRAFLIFNDLKDRKKCMRAYQKKINKKKLVPNDRLLLGEFPLKVKETTEPSNIHWENLEVPHKSRIIRRIVSGFVTGFILILSVATIFYFKSQETGIPTEEECQSVKDMNLSLAIKKYSSEEDILCYCRLQPYKDLLGHNDLNAFCEVYLEKSSLQILLMVFGSLGVIIINCFIKIILKKLSSFERMSTKTQEQLKIMLKVFVALFLNTALIVLLVNAKIEGSLIFKGDYDDFNRGWYLDVGASITLTMIISIGSPHLVHLLVLCPLKALKRRMCWRRYKTQHELNLAFKGAEFDMATKVSQILNVIFTCFLYSGGMPILNVVCFLALVCIYWTDKYLLLRYYNRTPCYSERINTQVIQLLPLAVAFHSAFSIYMYGSDDIFGLDEGNITDRVTNIAGILCLIMSALSFALFAWIFPIGTWIRKKLKLKKLYDNTRRGQGTYSQEIEKIKEHGIHSYDITQNILYKPLIISLNECAHRIRELEDDLYNCDNANVKPNNKLIDSDIM